MKAMKPEECTEESQWVERLRAGDEAGFETIYNRYWATLFSVAYSYTRSRATSQEIVQEIFVSVWLKRTTLPRSLDLKSYLFQAVRHKVYDHFDKQAVREQHAIRTTRLAPVSANTTDHQVAFDELHTVLNQQLELLPETTRKVFVLSRLNGLTIPEIAQEMQLSVKTVEYHLTKSLKLLRGCLEELLMLLFLLYL